MNYYLFLDETGNHGLSHLTPDFNIFLLCGVLMDAEEYQRFRERLNTIKAKFWNDKQVIFHSRDIRKCQKEFQILLNEGIKRDFYDCVNHAIADTDFTVIASAILKEDYINRFGRLSSDVYELCLSFIIERSIFLLDDFNDAEKRLYVILEERGKLEDRCVKEHFQRLLARGTGYVNSNRLKKYCLKIEFRSKKKNVNGLQLADMVAYPTARYILEPTRSNPAYEIFANKVYQKNGNVYGLKVYP